MSENPTNEGPSVLPVSEEPKIEVPVTPAPEAPVIPKKLPDIVQRIDNIIQEQSPLLVASIRKLRSDGGILFRGMTVAEIQKKFAVAMTGQENYPELRKKAADALVLYEEVSGYLLTLESEMELAKVYIEKVKAHLNQEIIVSNLSKTNRNDKISDAAREALVGRIFNVGDTGFALGQISVEIAVWKGVQKELDKVFETIDNTMQALACEYKYSGASQT